MSFFIVFLGVDGSGKSTIINKIKKEYHGVSSFHFCPTKRYNRKEIENTTPHGRNSYSKTVSFIKLLFLIISFNFGFFSKIKSNNNLIIGDRYFYDIYVDPRRYRLSLSRKIIKLCFNLIPKPQKVFVFTGNISDLLERKSEISKNEMNIQQKLLIQLAQEYSNWQVINSTQNSAESIVKKIMSEENFSLK